EIRLLTLHPGTRNDEIKCSLHVVSLFNCPAYEALSYAWGDPTPTRYDILLNEKTFSLARNLSRALPCLRSTTEPRTIWIDAICIDQTNLEERGSQVMIMRNIFSRAHRVVVWLGGYTEPDDFSPQGLLWDLMQRENPLESLARAGLVVRHFSELLDEIPSRERIAISRFLARPFFRRLWILQEIAVATEVVAMVGTVAFNWNSLIAA
ncbi:heterokaryon incompatibility protein-domain-containing protein, partial [Hyaloscypha sp. PMI_1271]